jgi:hypothetical protein
MRTIRGVIVTTRIIPALAAALLTAALAASAALAAGPPRPPAASHPAAPLPAASHSASSDPSPGLLTGVAFSSPRHGYGLFTDDRGSRCEAAVGTTPDGGRRFTRPVHVATWSCGGSAPAATLAAGNRSDVYWFGPALFTSQDGGRAWHRARPGGLVLALTASGRSAWALVARCRGGDQRTVRCPVRLIVSADGGRTWRAARHQPPGATVPVYQGQPEGSAGLVRTRSATYVLTGPAPMGRPAGARIWVSRGATWARHRVPCGLEGLSAALAVSPGGTIFVACASQPSAGAQAKSLAWSADGGRTWTLHRPCRTGAGPGCRPVSSGYLSQIAAPAGRTVFLTGPRSSLLITRDGGRAWRLVRPLIGDDGGGTGQVQFFGPAGRAGSIGLVFGFDGRHDERPAIWHTADGGARWQVVYPVIS